MTSTVVRLVAAGALCAFAFGSHAQEAGGEWTLERVDPADPFGEIDVTLTMLDPKTISAWASGLTEERQAELRGRCALMLQHEARFDIADRSFCRTLLEG